MAPTEISVGSSSLRFGGTSRRAGPQDTSRVRVLRGRRPRRGRRRGRSRGRGHGGATLKAMNINVSTAAARRWGRPIALCPPLSRAWRRFYVPLRGAVLEPAQESGVLSIGAERRFFCLVSTYRNLHVRSLPVHRHHHCANSKQSTNSFSLIHVRFNVIPSTREFGTSTTRGGN